MATHFSILPWRIPWTEEPGELQSIGSQRVVHDWSNSAQHAQASGIKLTQSQPLPLDFSVTLANIFHFASTSSPPSLHIPSRTRVRVSSFRDQQAWLLSTLLIGKQRSREVERIIQSQKIIDTRPQTRSLRRFLLCLEVCWGLHIQLAAGTRSPVTPSQDWEKTW